MKSVRKILSILLLAAAACLLLMKYRAPGSDTSGRQNSTSAPPDKGSFETYFRQPESDVPDSGSTDTWSMLK